MTNHRVVAWAILALACIGLARPSAVAQVKAGESALSAASVKYLCEESSGCTAKYAGGVVLDPVHFHCAYCTFSGLMMEAFGLHRGAQVVGVPSGLEDSRYSVEISLIQPADSATMRNSIRRVVVEAFDVRWHLEDRAFPALDLVVRDRAPKFTRLDQAPAAAPHFDSATETADFYTMAELVDWLNSFLERTGTMVIDRTDLTGNFDIQIHTAALRGSDPTPLFALVKEQTGLDFVPTKDKGHLGYVVVDHAQPLRGSWTMPE